MLNRFVSLTRPAPPYQGEFSFLRRSRRLERTFKAAILATTVLVLVGMLLGTLAGRRLAEATRLAVEDGAARLLGFELDRAEIEARKARGRALGIEMTRRNLIRAEEWGGPKHREFLKVARLDHDSAILRWGNFDWTLALSSAVFEPDDSGRSYRLRPNTRSVWLINFIMNDVTAMFEIPDTPEARRLGEAVGGKVVPESVQTTNSWGCRGSEPDPKAPVRGIVLGDSNMQGLLVGDDQSPPARLETRLRETLGMPVSILNTGHLGYSPEQYYYSLVAYHDRFRPQFVIVSLCSNDFGDMGRPENWTETDHWLDAITQFCRTRDVDFVILPLPVETTILGNRNQMPYPAKLTAILHGSGSNYVDPIEEFATEELRLRADASRRGERIHHSPLFNQKYQDHHLSPVGSDLWAKIVARRLGLIWGQKPGRLARPDEHSGRSRKAESGPSS